MRKYCLLLLVLFLVLVGNSQSSFIKFNGLYTLANPANEFSNQLSNEKEDILKNSDCSTVSRINSSQLNITKCYFVQHAVDCAIEDGFVNYLTLPYCLMPGVYWLAMIILFLWLGYLFISLGAAAEEFFCPNLNTIANTLRLSQNVAGVTFLAFGNGAPDIFSVISAVRASKGGEAGMAIGELFGAGMFITTVIVGTISLVKPCHLPTRPFLRDSIIYLFSVYATFIFLWYNSIGIYQSVGFILAYVIYVIIVVAGRELRTWYLRRKKRNPQHRSHVNEEPISTHNVVITSPDREDNVNILTPGSRSYGAIGHSEEPLLKINESPVNREGEGVSGRGGEININRTSGVAFLGEDEQRRAEESMPALGTGRVMQRRVSVYLTDFSRDDILSSLKEFLWAISPITPDYRKLNYFWKFFQFVKYPIWLLLTITIPVVDLKADKQSWKKWLFVLQSFLWPTFSVLATKLGFYRINGYFPLWGLSLIFGFFLATFVIMSSSYRIQPFYHKLFSFIGFGVSVIWIYSLANEVVNVLQAFGVVLSLTKAILGLTFLAWGNSVGDFVADVTLARQGYPQTGLSACYGGPLLNTLLGIGFAWTVKCITSGQLTFDLKFSPLELVSAAFLTFNLCLTLVVMTIMGYKLHWVFGVYLLLYYVLFLVVGILLEVGVINICLPNITPTC